MKLELWYTEFNPYSSWGTGPYWPYVKIIDDPDITRLDSLSLDGISYTEQEGRIVEVSNIDYNQLGSFRQRIIGNPLASPISKFLATRAIIKNDDGTVYIDGLILRQTVNYSPKTKTVSFSISDMMSVLIEWFNKLQVIVWDNNTWSSYIDFGQLTVGQFSTTNIDGRFTFSRLLSQINEGSQFDKVIGNANYGATSHQAFTIQSNVSSTIIVKDQNRIDSNSYISYYTISNDNEYPIVTGIAQVSDTKFDIILLEMIKYQSSPTGTSILNRYMIKPWIYRFDNGFFSIIEPEPDENTLIFYGNDTLSVQPIIPLTITFAAIEASVGLYVAGEGYGCVLAYDEDGYLLSAIKGMCERVAVGPVTWTNRSMPTTFTVGINNDSVSANLSVTYSTFISHTITGSRQERFKTNLNYELNGDFAYTRTNLKPGKYKMIDLLRDISLSTDNYLYYEYGSVFKLAPRSTAMTTAIATLSDTDISSNVKGLDLNVRVNLKLTSVDDARYDFNGELEKYYQDIVNEQYNTEITVLVDPIADFNLGNNVILNGKYYKIFGIDYYNGLYSLKLYGKGFTA